MIPLLVALAPIQAPAATPAPTVRTVRVETRARIPGDPYERFNRKAFAAHQRFDRAVLRPAALGYRHVVPSFLRSALRHIISNLGEPVVFVNYLLQLKPGKAAETVGRFAINSTLGFGGAVDIAKSPGVKLPHRPNGLGDTLGFYGVKPGPYLFLPFVGPTNFRDLLGGQADGLLLPLAVGKPFDQLYYQIPRGLIAGLDLRAESDADLKALLDDAVDPYASLRSAYLQYRAGEIAQLKGRRAAASPAPELGEPFADPGGGHASPDAAPELQDPLTDPAATALAPATNAPVETVPTPPTPELDDPLAHPAAKTPRP